MPSLPPPGSPVGGTPAPGSPASGTLPATTPQAFATYVDDFFAGTNGKKGSPLAYLTSLGYTGSTLGAQWLSFYAAEQAKYGSQYSLLETEQAFVTLYEEGQLGNNLAAGTAGGLAAAGATTLSGAQTAESIFSVLQSGALWLRVAEGVLGIILIAIGLARITHAVPVATQIAKTAGAVL